MFSGLLDGAVAFGRRCAFCPGCPASADRGAGGLLCGGRAVFCGGRTCSFCCGGRGAGLLLAVIGALAGRFVTGRLARTASFAFNAPAFGVATTAGLPGLAEAR